MATFKAACVQVNASNDIDTNIADFGDLIRRARDAGADFITTPEVVGLMEVGTKNIFAKSFPEASHPAVAAFAALAKDTGAWLLAGSLTIKLDESKLANRSMLFDPSGAVVARYDKIHMFDVNLPNGESYRESKNYRPGAEAVVTDLPWGRLGMTVCYDIRFPHLYRNLARAGAEILTIPSAFTRPTGKAHWHVLNQARAIENGCFVISAAQCGIHAGDRKTYGHSLIVAPWGEIVAEAGEEPGVITADIDMEAVSTARHRVPSLQHDRPYAGAAPASAAAAAE